VKLKLCQSGFHFREGVLISGAPGGFDSSGKAPPRIVSSRKFGEKLPVLEVAGHVVRVRGEKLVEIFDGGGMVALVSALHGQAVARERIIRMRGHKLLEHFPARLFLALLLALVLRLVHGSSPRIIPVRRRITKPRGS
jgi:hypothetical protein